MRRNGSQIEFLKLETKKLYLAILCFLQLAITFAQTGEIVFTRTTKENGLASSRVTAMLKDSKGFFWISTVNGLQRFDGSRMVIYRNNPADSATLPNNELGMLLKEDNKNRLWIHTESGLCVYQPMHRNFRIVKFENFKRVAYGITSFIQDSRGLIWITVDDEGLFVLDTVQNIFRAYTSVWPGFSARILSIAEDKRNGYYWLNTADGLALYDDKKKEYHHKKFNPNGLKCFMQPGVSSKPDFIYKDNNDILWIYGKGNGPDYIIHRYDIKGNELIAVNNQGDLFMGFLTDASGNTWGYGKILARYDKKTNRFAEIPKKKESLYGIDFNEIHNLYEDGEYNIWIMTDMGLYGCNLRQQHFTTRNIISHSAHQATDAHINGFVQTSDGHIIALGSQGDGLYFFDSAFTRINFLYGYNPQRFSDKNYLSAWCGLQDSKGIIWIGCEAGRLLQLNPSTNRITTLHVPELEGKTIRSMSEDKNGNIWMGTNNNTIVKWTRSSNSFKQIVYGSDIKFEPEWVLRILPGYENDLWVATTGAGLLRINLATDKLKEQFLPDNNPQSIGSYYVVDILILNPDTYAIATEGGIDLFDWRKKTFSRIGEADGLPSTGIYSMVKDDHDNLWFSSVDGISKIYLPDKRIKNYGRGDGITGEDFQSESDYKYVNAARFKNNDIAFGNPRGFVSFNPGSINEIAAPADVSITGFRIFNRSLSVDSLFQKSQTIRLSHAQNYITIQFSSLGNVMYNRPVYYYMLEGFDKDWVLSGSSQEAIYTYLSGGNYIFKVKCFSQDGVPGKNITSIPIYIKPPYYQTWWFYLLAIILVLSVIYFVYRARVNKLLALEKLRAKVARDLHDDMGSVLSTINILSTMTKTKMADDPVKASEYVGKISDNSQRMMETMDDIVWSIKPANDSMQKITARMREFATGILEAKDIELDFKVAEKVNDVRLNMEARRDFFLIFKEAVNNVAKYSHCSKCSIHIALHQHRLILDIHDNGVGFDVSKADSGNGLSNMQKRAEALKGRATVQSKPDEGTRVILNIPVM